MRWSDVAHGSANCFEYQHIHRDHPSFKKVYIELMSHHVWSGGYTHTDFEHPDYLKKKYERPHTMRKDIMACLPFSYASYMRSSTQHSTRTTISPLVRIISQWALKTGLSLTLIRSGGKYLLPLPVCARPAKRQSTPMEISQCIVFALIFTMTRNAGQQTHIRAHVRTCAHFKNEAK